MRIGSSVCERQWWLSLRKIRHTSSWAQERVYAVRFKKNLEYEWFLNMNFRAVTNLPHLKGISSSRFGWFLKKWGNFLFRASSRSHVTSYTPYLLHCTMQIRTSEFLVLFVTVFRILTGTSWYRRSGCKFIASTGTCSVSGTLKYLLNCETWNTGCMSDIPSSS